MAVSQKAYKVALERLNTYIREHKMRPSKERSLILTKICQLPQPFTAEQLTEVCQKEDVSRATVYNTLKLFLLAQILCSIKREHGSTFTKYEIITGLVRMQTVCTRCGKVTEFHDKAIASMLFDRVYSNYVTKRLSITVYGECKICRSLVKAKKQKTK